MKNTAFWVVSIMGTIVRCVVAVIFPTRAWIDEIWVVYDPAYRMLTGVGPVERDWFWKVRDHIPPSIVYVYLKFLNILGINDGLFVQASIRFWIALFTSLSIIAFLILLARIFKLNKLPWLAAIVCFFIPDLIHYSATADLSVLGIPPLLFGLTLLFWDIEDGDTDWKTRLGSALIVFSVLIRFQFGIFPAVIVIGLLLKQKFKPALELFLIGLLFIILDIVFNTMMYGQLVFPLINYFLVNTTGGVAASYGVTPFYFAFELLWKFMTEPVFLVSVLFSIYCFKKTPVLTSAIFLFYIFHVFIGHKEYRFFYGAALTISALGSVGFESWIEASKKKFFIPIFLILFFAVAGFRAMKKTDFKAYMIPHKLEALAGREPDLKGIITYGWGGIYQGCNYTVFKPIPCVFAENKDQLKTKSIDASQFTHVITGSAEPAPCINQLHSEGGGTLYKCTPEEIQSLVK